MFKVIVDHLFKPLVLLKPVIRTFYPSRKRSKIQSLLLKLLKIPGNGGVDHFGGSLFCCRGLTTSFTAAQLAQADWPVHKLTSSEARIATGYWRRTRLCERRVHGMPFSDQNGFLGDQDSFRKYSCSLR
jgi:hypothetical protein